MLLLTAQVLLVLTNRVGWHRRLGWFSAGWACLLAVMGPWGVIATAMYDVKLHGPLPYPFMSVHAVPPEPGTGLDCAAQESALGRRYGL